MSSGWQRNERDRLIAEASHARHRGRIRKAIALYRRILVEEPGNAEVAVRLAPLVASRGEHFEAWLLFRDVARRLLAEQRYEQCLAVAREACRFVPGEFDAWRLRADLELKLGRERAAFETLLEARSVFSSVRTGAQAIALLVRARGIEPWDPQVCIDLARLYARSDRVQAACELLNGLEGRVVGRDLRRVRALQWRLTLSFEHAWRWLQAAIGLGADARAGASATTCFTASEDTPRLR
ncbi:MAG: tetratricopeptide repeat protein [Myxococcota bacterium]